jgi:NitT/TauT family transport system substrate-binding protein
LTVKDINIVSLRLQEVIAALQSKNIDAASVTEPTATTITRQGLAVPVARTGDLFPDAVAAALIGAPAFVQEQPEAAQRFVIAYLRGLREYYHAFNKNDTDKEPVIQSYINHTPFKDPGMYHEMGLPSVEPNGNFDPTPSWTEWQDYFLATGLVPRKIDIGKYVDFTLVNMAVAKLGHDE